MGSASAADLAQLNEVFKDMGINVYDLYQKMDSAQWDEFVTT